MSSTLMSWYWDADSLVGELRRGGFGPVEMPRIAGFDEIKEIRRGGQGIVFSAIQRSTKRPVAVKVLLEGAFASVSGRRRFEREIDLVAGLRHPNIVSVHDSGLTSDGQLYFVMEFVDGLPFDQHVASVKTAEGPGAVTRGLLALFAKICDAVHYAHQRGVIHRDLKPSNILVDSAGEPRVCDFGLAKATTEGGADPREAHSMSVTGQFMGSLPWASPEQLEGSHTRVDVRTDVYSLGVILYQMLCGRHPYDLGGGIRLLFESITRAQPARPSVHAKHLDNELDTITLKCLAKNSQERYQSAAELGADIRHYLAGEPIQAKRDSAWYTLRKTLRRYQVAAAVAGVVLAVLVTALAVSTWSWRGARQEAAQRAAIGDFLGRMLTSVDPGRDGGEVRFLDVINKAASEIGATVGDQPLVEGQIRRTLGSSYSALGMYEAAQTQFALAHEACVRALGPSHRTSLEVLVELPKSAAARGQLEDAERRGRSALDVIRQALGGDDPLTLRMTQQLGDILNLRGKSVEAEAMLRAALDGQQRVLGDHHEESLWTMNSLAVLMKQTGRYDEAEILYRLVVAEVGRIKGERDQGVLTAASNLALALQAQGKLDESEALQRQTLKTRLAVLGEEHPDTLVNMSNLATLLIDRRKLKAADELLRRVVEVETRTLGLDHPATQTALNNLAKVVQDLGRYDEAERLFRQALAARQRVLGPEHSMTLMTEANLAALYDALGRKDECMAILRRVLAARQRTLGDEHFDTLVSKNNLAMMLQKAGNLEEAASLFDSASESAANSLQAGHYLIGLFRGNQGRCLMGLGRLSEAGERLEQACTILEAAFGTADSRTQQNIQSLVQVYDRLGDGQKSGPWRAKLTTTQPAVGSAAGGTKSDSSKNARG